MWSVTEYLSRIEEASLDILETQTPIDIDKSITLWWGLDGLRLNEDGTFEWISRKKSKPINPNISYQMCQSIQPIQMELQQTIWADQTQCTKDQLNTLMSQNIALQMQSMQNGNYYTYRPYYTPYQMYPTYPMYPCFCPTNLGW